MLLFAPREVNILQPANSYHDRPYNTSIQLSAGAVYISPCFSQPESLLLGCSFYIAK